MKARIGKIGIVLLALLTGAVQAINIKYIKGTYEVLKPEYRHLSPVHGAVWWEKGLAQKYYTFGFYGKSIPKTKKGIARAPYGTVALIRDLFHEVQGSFNVTKSPGATAFHFSAETVAKIIATIEKYKDKPVGKLVTDLRTVIASDTDFQASIQKYTPKYEELREKVQIVNKKESELKKKFAELLIKKKEAEAQNDTLALKEIQDQVGQINREISTIAQVKSDFGQYNIKDAQGRKLNILTNAIIASLEECGFVKSQEKPSYPKETTHSVLLAFLYRKAEEKSEFKNYFDELANFLKASVLTDQGIQQVAKQEWITDAFDDSKAGIEKELAEIKQVADVQVADVGKDKQSLDALLAKISLAKIVFGEVSRPQSLPHIAQYRDTTQFEGITFPDCAETTMRNLSNIATYNAKENRFDVAQFKNVDSKIQQFYKEYSNAADIENEKVHNAWVPIIENRPLVAYHRIVAPDNPQKIAVAPSGTQGFIYGFKDIQKLKPEAVNINFYDNSSDALQKVKINDGEYILIDPKQYHAFEVRPSLRNTIILMNQFFGLGLYKDLNTDFFDKDFNKTYFPELTKKFDWQYDEDAIPDLDANDYANKPGFKIELTTKAGGKFLLSLVSDRHGYIEVISTKEVENYEKKLFTLAKNELIKGQGQVAADMLCMYNYNEASGLDGTVFNTTKQDFMNAKLPYLVTYLYYLQNLNEPNTAVQIIKDLMKQNDPVLLNLAAKLIESLPMRADLYYQGEVAKAIKETKGQPLQNASIRKVLDEIIEKVMRSDVTYDTLHFFLDYLIPNYSKLVDFAEKGATSNNKNYQKNGLLLFSGLVKSGFAYDKATQAIQLLLEKKEVPGVAYILLDALVKEGKALDSAIQFIQKKAVDETSRSKMHKLITIESLLKNKDIMQNKDTAQKIIDIAMQDALQTMKDETVNINDMLIKKEALGIFGELVLQGYSYQEAIEAAQIAILLESYPIEMSQVRGAAKSLFVYRLFPKKEGFDEALQVAKKAMQNEDEYIQSIGLELFIGLVKNDKAFDEAVQATKQGLKSNDFSLKFYAKQLKELLQEKGKWPEEK